MKKLLLSIAVSSTLALVGCDGDDGNDGINGTDGSDGLTSLISSTELDEGHEVCLGGGVQIDSGVDDNSDGVLSDDEIDETSYACLSYDAITGAEITEQTLDNPWYEDGQEYITNALNTAYDVEVSATSYSTASADTAPTTTAKAKNIILFVGDGMGISTVTAARILEGQQDGGLGEDHVLSFGEFEFAGLAKTYNVNQQTPDSAGTMTAMMSGVKTDVGVIGVDEDIERGECSTVDGNELVTALELAEIAGKSTGIISTARITHATPAATYAKSADRNWEDISDMPDDATDCEDIASQLVYFESNLEARYDGLDVDGIEVAMGGGRRHFLPKDEAYNSSDAVSDVEGDRTDGVDLTAVWQALYPDGSYVYDESGFEAIDTAATTKLFGLFNESHMQYEADRHNDVAGEPSLEAMTRTAIEVLDNNEEGFFLMVESGRIDHGHHAGSAYNALTDTIEFAEAVQAAVESTDPSETLIIVTADHSHVFTIAGYPKRGNPILGKVVNVGETEPAEASDGMPYTTLGYTNGQGFQDFGDDVTDADVTYYVDANTGRADLTDVDTESSGFHQEALVATGAETHAGEDVGIYATGPGASLVTGTNEQSIIFHIMNFAGELSDLADAAIEE